ncbi:hypothetical protein [Nocardiopsis sp. FR26]|uniref:hypothetical protein n=1 Tax=Nocardiopsis sp. FR26 TaxID=2605987 RepID=UPI00135CC359|nr:hypothetical protein [Nocardiopsis sp. FR26]
MAIDVRPMGDPEEINAFVAALENTPGIRVVRSSGDRPNRRDPGVHRYLTVEVDPTLTATEVHQVREEPPARPPVGGGGAIPLPPA